MKFAEAKARIITLRNERAEIAQADRTARAGLYDTGSYGQASQRKIDDAENAGMLLNLWDEEHGEELANLLAKCGKQFGPEILDHRV